MRSPRSLFEHGLHIRKRTALPAHVARKITALQRSQAQLRAPRRLSVTRGHKVGHSELGAAANMADMMTRVRPELETGAALVVLEPHRPEQACVAQPAHGVNLPLSIHADSPLCRHPVCELPGLLEQVDDRRWKPGQEYVGARSVLDRQDLLLGQTVGCLLDYCEERIERILRTCSRKRVVL